MQLDTAIWTYKGNYYRVTSTVGSFKHPDTRDWVPAVHRRRYWTEYYTARGCSYNKVQKLVGRKMRSITSP